MGFVASKPHQSPDPNPFIRGAFITLCPDLHNIIPLVCESPRSKYRFGTYLKIVHYLSETQNFIGPLYLYLLNLATPPTL